MRACWLKWVGRDWSISADYIWLNYSDANSVTNPLNTLFTMTRFVSQIDLVLAMYELCGWFSVFEPTPAVEMQ